MSERGGLEAVARECCKTDDGICCEFDLNGNGTRDCARCTAILAALRRAAPPADGGAKYREALEEMVYQHCPIRYGRFDDMALSANEFALDVLGPDFHPSADEMCEIPGCGNGWTEATPETHGSPVGYHRRCHEHPFRARAAGTVPSGTQSGDCPCRGAAAPAPDYRDLARRLAEALGWAIDHVMICEATKVCYEKSCVKNRTIYANAGALLVEAKEKLAEGK